MSFECPYYNNNKCHRMNSVCNPGKGKCILKGKVVQIKDNKYDKSNDNDNDK